MTLTSRILLVCIAAVAFSTPAGAFSKRPPDTWVYYHFDGSSFQPGPATDGGSFLAIRNRFQPVVAQSAPPVIDAPPISAPYGAIAGICYFSTSGGKSGSAPGYTPCSNTPLFISSGNRPPVTVRTDGQGYFVVELEAGSYSIGSGPFTTNVTVEQGATSLIPLRAGKRMVD